MEIYTDGSSKGNPGPGGYGVVILKDNEIYYHHSVQCEQTTNNKEELKAILHAFEFADHYPNSTFIVYSDSAYCVNICNDWIFKWARNNWKKANKKPVENLDLIKSLYKYLSKDFFNCQVVKTNAHVGIVENELADALATNNQKKFQKIIKENGISL